MSMLEDECSQCGSNKRNLPTLKLLYSTCCGRQLCQTCVSKIPSRAGAKCGQCSFPITNRDFTSDTIEAQLYNKELAVKQRLAQTFVLQRVDFASDVAFEDYHELISDVIYDIVNGKKQQADAAEQRVLQWKADNQAKIDAANKRQQAAVKAASKQHNNDNAAAAAAASAQQSVAAQALNFSLPSAATGKHSLYISKSDEQAELERINAIADLTERKQKLSEFYAQKKVVEEKASLAGGMNRTDDVNRSLMEASYCLFDFD